MVEHTPIDWAVEALPGVSRLTLVVEQRRLEGNQEVLEYLPVARVPMQRHAAGSGGTEPRRGIRVIPDASLNHVGSDSVYFNRYGHHGDQGDQGAFQNGRIHPASPYADWFSLDPTPSDPDQQFKGWVGVRDLPELNKASPAWRRFAYGDRQSVMKVRLDRGAAGWRMDVAPWVPDDFWRT